MRDEASIYGEWVPPEPWRGVVACCWEQHVGTDLVQRVLPDAHADLLFYEDGRIEVVGLFDHVDLPLLRSGTRVRGIRLRPHAVAAALHVDASSLQNATLPLETILGSARADSLRDDGTLEAWTRSIEPSPRTAHAVRLLARRSVEEAAAALGVAPRQLLRPLVHDVGAAPKALQRVLRMQRVVQAAERSVGLAAAAAEARYADQAHMTR